MQISTRDGITCDLCSTTSRTDFTYYSYDFRKVMVNNGHVPSIDMILDQELEFSLDVCTSCHKVYSDLVVNNYSSIMSNNTKKRGHKPKLICEMSGDDIHGDYYYCSVILVNVAMSGQPNICSNCQQKTYDDDKPCSKCNNNNFIRFAMTNTNNRIYEFNICSDQYRKIVHKAEKIRELASQWTTDTN